MKNNHFRTLARELPAKSRAALMQATWYSMNFSAGRSAVTPDYYHLAEFKLIRYFCIHLARNMSFTQKLFEKITENPALSSSCMFFFKNDFESKRFCFCFVLFFFKIKTK